MTSEEQAAFEQKIKAYVGRRVGKIREAKDAVNQPMIRHWCEAMGDTNPAYTDPEWAANSRRGGIVAPPAMLYCWTQEGYGMLMRGREHSEQTELEELFNSNGFFGVVATDVTQEYENEARLGDVILEETVIESVSDQKKTALGTGYFYQTLSRFTNQDGTLIGTQTFRVLKYKPAKKSD
jgi:hypothetical protein